MVIIGGFINGWSSARYGYRRTVQVALVWMTGAIFISFFAVNIQMLLVGQMLCGLSWGVYATTGK
jgi:SP family general alpha glucoside:H+ symporter-like MFS transporter